MAWALGLEIICRWPGYPFLLSINSVLYLICDKSWPWSETNKPGFEIEACPNWMLLLCLFPFPFPFPSQSTFVSGSITRTQNHTDGSEAMKLCLYRWKIKQPGNGKLCLFNTPYFQSYRKENAAISWFSSYTQWCWEEKWGRDDNS